MFAHRRLAILLFLCLAQSSSASEFTLLSQTRWVSVSGEAESPGWGLENASDADTAEGSSEFVASIVAEASAHYSSARSTADQDSRFSDFSLVASGSVTTSSGSTWFPGGGSYANGSSGSWFEVRLSLASGRSYHIAGMLAAYGSSTASLELKQGSVTLQSLVASNGAELPLDVSGRLPAGEYVLRVRSSAESSAADGTHDDSSSSYAVTVAFGELVPVKPSSFTRLKSLY